MLRIVRSNRVESLLERLADRIAADPLASPFVPEIVVAPSPAMARWVNLGLARRLGVAANLVYPLPSSFVWDLCRARLDALPETDPLALDRMAWQIFAQLPSLLTQPAFEPLRHYLGQDADGLKRWQLASRIADVFDRYQLYRPELVRRWSDGGDPEDWQAALWHRLSEGLKDRHRVASIDRLLQSLGAPGPGGPLPERVSLFAVSSLPPLLVEVLHALAEHTAVDLYLHAPTDAFWADLVSQKDKARKRLERPEESDLWEVGNALLASWGRQGQALQDLLLAPSTHPIDDDAFAEPSPLSPEDPLLIRLQRDIFSLRGLPRRDEREAVRPDDSIQVHLCHSPLRECQVLHDALLGMLEADPGLRPEDILVMVPEIGVYAPYIEAVFAPLGARTEHQEGDSGGSRPFIPWNLSDISAKDEHPLATVFLQLLGLPESRFTRSEILSYLDVPELAERFGLDGESVAQVKDWLAQANLRWGLDGEHKRRLGLPATEENTWAQAERRLLGGYALGPCDLFDGIAPIDGVEGTRAEALGRFWRLLATLSETAGRLAAPRTARDWETTVAGLLADFFAERLDEDGQSASRLQRIRDAAAELAEQAGDLDEPLSPALIRSWLAERLESESRRGRYFSGGVTFCGMRPMRSLPFETICVLGLQDLAFPRRDRLAEFDLMRKQWRPGDPRKGDEDRYLFLETLLCARRCLYLSYVGRDIRNNAARQPSVLVRELLDYIDQHFRIADADPQASLAEGLTRVHPLQPFSPRAFAKGRGSYDGYWCEVARAMQAAPDRSAETRVDWNRSRLPAAPDRMRDIGLSQLLRFVRHPIRYFVASRLQVFLQTEAPEEDTEPFAVEGLARYALRQRLVDDRLRGARPSPRQLSAEGRLPHGGFAGLVFDEQESSLTPLAKRLRRFQGRRPVQRPIELRLAGEGPARLVGQVEGIYPGEGLLRWTPAKLKGADILALWVNHLAWCLADDGAADRGSDAAARCSVLHALDATFRIEVPLDREQAQEALLGYLGWYWEGIHRPLLVLPKASYAFARARLGGGKDPFDAARAEWNGNSYQDIAGDKDDPYIRLVTRGTGGDPLRDGELVQLAEDFYHGVLALGELQ